MKKTSWKNLTIIPLLLCITGITGCANQQANNKQLSNTILDKHFEFDLIIPVAINGKVYNFLVDTGASVTIIDKKLADQITRPLRSDEITKNYREEFSSVSSVHSTLAGDRYTLVKPVPFSIGSEEIGDNDIWITTDTTLFSQSKGVDIHGILGIDTIRKFNWQVDNDKQRLLVTKNPPSAREWQHCTGYSDHYNSSPQLLLEYGNDDALFRIDTGSDTNYVGTEFVEFAKTKKESLISHRENLTSVDMGGIVNTSSYILKGLSFNGLPLGEFSIVSNTNQSFAVGMDFLARFKRYAIIPSRMMFCYDASSIEKTLPVNYRSLAIRYIDNHIELFYNSNDDLQGTGLRNGDILLAINGITYPPAQIDKVRKILAETPPGKLNITIQRGAQKQELRL